EYGCKDRCSDPNRPAKSNVSVATATSRGSKKDRPSSLCCADDDFSINRIPNKRYSTKKGNIKANARSKTLPTVIPVPRLSEQSLQNPLTNFSKVPGDESLQQRNPTHTSTFRLKLVAEYTPTPPSAKIPISDTHFF